MTADTVTAIAAAVIAVASLGVSVWEGLQTRRHNRRSVTPRLRIDVVHDVGSPLLIRLINSGIGPAVVRSFVVLVDGQIVEPGAGSPWQAAFERIELPGDFFLYTPSVDDTFAAGEQQDLVRFQMEPTQWEHVRSLLERIAVEIQYESIYREHYSLSAVLGGLRPNRGMHPPAQKTGGG